MTPAGGAEPGGERKGASVETRRRVGEMAAEAIAAGDPVGWFERLYAAAGGELDQIPWADLEPNPLLEPWLRARQVRGAGRRALVVGAGLGDDAELLAAQGFATVGFDVSPTAVEWARERNRGSGVEYVVADLLALPGAWRRRFDLVVEAYTLQALPPGETRASAARALATPVAPGGSLLVIERLRDDDAPVQGIPWPLARGELRPVEEAGLDLVSFEDVPDTADPPKRWLRATYMRPHEP